MFGNPLYAEKINDAIANIDLPETPKKLYDPIIYILSLSGKRVRPQLVLMGGAVFGYDRLDDLLPASTCVEYFHNFSLIHDDIMDKAPLRRGKDTVHQKWDDNVAILSGDALLVKAYSELAKCPSDKIAELLKVFNQMALGVCEGQQMDMDFEERTDVKEEEYIEMIRLKTSVLLGGALELGAIIAGADQLNRQLIYDFGVNLGIAFQLQDDILDAFGNPADFGKQVGGDIIVNKKTILHILLKNALVGIDVADFERILSLSAVDSEVKVSEMKKMYEKYEILGLANALKEYYTSLAYQNLEQMDVPNERKADLHQLANTLINRIR